MEEAFNYTGMQEHGKEDRGLKKMDKREVIKTLVQL